ARRRSSQKDREILSSQHRLVQQDLAASEPQPIGGPPQRVTAQTGQEGVGVNVAAAAEQKQRAGSAHPRRIGARQTSDARERAPRARRWVLGPSVLGLEALDALS